MMVVVQCITIISSQEDFAIIDKEPSGIYVIGNNITLKITDKDLVSFFSGSLSGTRATLEISKISNDFQLIRNMKGVLKDCNILITSDVTSNADFSIMHNMENGLLTNIAFSMESAVIQKGINISFFNAISSSVLTSCFFTQLYHMEYINTTILGISMNLFTSKCTNINVNQNIKNVENVHGVCFNLGSQIEINITQTLSYINVIYGVAKDISKAQENIVILSHIVDSNFVYGVSYSLSEQLINADIQIYIDLHISSHQFIGVSHSVSGDLKNINMWVDYSTINDEGSMLKLDFIGLAYNLDAKITIQNIAFIFKSKDLFSQHFIYLMSTNSIQVKQIHNVAVSLDIITDNSKGLYLSLTSQQITSKLQQFYIQCSISAIDDTSQITITLFAQDVKNSILTKMLVNFNLRVPEFSTEKLIFQLMQKGSSVDIQNITSIVIIGSKKTSGAVSGVADVIQSSNITHCIFKYDLGISNINFYGISREIGYVNTISLSILGQVQAGPIFGLASTFIFNNFHNTLFNLNMFGSTCYTTGNILQESNISMFVDQSRIVKCSGDVLAYGSISNTQIDSGSGFLKAQGKSDQVFNLTESQMQNGNFVEKLVNTGMWEVSEDFNSGMVRLKNMFTVDNFQKIELREQEVEPFLQRIDGSIYLKDQQNLCIGSCHGTYDGNTTVCETGYQGEACDFINCSAVSCGINGICTEEGCECGLGQKGTLCEQNFCEICNDGGDLCVDVINMLPFCISAAEDYCLHGENVNSVCYCDKGYESVKAECDTFRCDDDEQCHGNLCFEGHCFCESPMAGLSCKFSTDILDDGHKVVCEQGPCQYGIGCMYLVGDSGQWECSVCSTERSLPTCQDCNDGFFPINDGCYQICKLCTTGKCYYLEACVDMDPGHCQYECDSCNPGISGKQCDQCGEYSHFYEWACRTVLDPGDTFGYCFEYEAEYLCLSCLSDYIIYEQKCVLECKPSNCINGKCLLSQECRCDKYFTGSQCDTCVSGTQLLDGECVQICQTCKGQCFYNANNIIFCQSCDIGYYGQQCLDCEAGYLDIYGSCFQVCDTCSGQNCYIDDKGVKICPLECFDGYVRQSCETCDTEYEQILGKCQLKCQTCVQGDCYQINDNTIYCTKCNFNLVGTQCDYCLDGFIMDNFQCHKQVTTDQCFMKNEELFCLSCEDGKILISNQCYQQCDLPECTGNCYFIDTSFVCISCYSGYILHNSKCFKQNLNPNGECYDDGQDEICKCYSGYRGETCEECEYFEINQRCYFQFKQSNGDCYKDVSDYTKKICKSCLPQYILPLCSDCNTGYQMDSKDTCLDCQPGYISSNTLSPDQVNIIGKDRCMLKCEECIQGECFYVGDDVICTQCREGFSFHSNCNECAVGYTRVGSYCFLSNSGESTFGDNINFECGDLKQSFNCSLCTVGNSDTKECKQHSVIHPGQCFIIDTDTECQKESCLQYKDDSEKCQECDSQYLLMNQSCWKSLDQENNRFRGICYASNGQYYCQQCQVGWNGSLCSECQKNYIKCPCQTEMFSLCCCPVINKNGVCYRQQIGGVVCQQCKQGYVLEETICMPKKRSFMFLLYWILPMVIVLSAILGISIWLIRIGSTKRFRMLIKYKKIVQKIGVRLLFVVLAQILSAIIALQDQFINDFYMQVTVNIFSMIPFVIYFVLFARPDKKQYFFNRAHHFVLFIFASLLELCYNIIQFDAVPDILQDFGQQMYKLAGPSVTLLLCIFFAGYIFTGKQKIALYCGLIIPITFQFTLAIMDSLRNGFFTGMGGLDIILGQTMIGLAIIINGLYFYSLSVILGKYGEMGSIGRFAVSSITVNSAVGMVYPQQIIFSVFQTDIFTFSLVSQIFFNIINIIVMSRLSAVEFSINLISSAIWVQFISEIGSLKYSNENYYPKSGLILFFEILALIILFCSIVMFYAAESGWYNNKNMRFDRKENNGLIESDFESITRDELMILDENAAELASFRAGRIQQFSSQNLLSSRQIDTQNYKVNIMSEEGQLLLLHQKKQRCLLDQQLGSKDRKLYQSQCEQRELWLIQQRFQFVKPSKVEQNVSDEAGEVIEN